MKKTQPWFVGAAMRALGEHVKDTSTPFGAAQLARWSSDLTRVPGLARSAIDRLVKHQMAAPCAMRGRQGSADRALRWHLTQKGLSICEAVAHAQKTQAPAGSTLASRVWALLRIRRQLTSDEALSLLADAGEEVGRMQRTIAGYLAAWAQGAPDVVQLSAQRVNGCKRYVLLRDIGMQHPRVDGRAHVAVPKIEPMPDQLRGSAAA